MTDFESDPDSTTKVEATATQEPPRRRRRRNASQWRTLIDQQRVSGQSIKAFCTEHGLGEASFYAWRRWLDQTAGRSHEPSNHAGPSRSQPADASGQSTKPDEQPTSAAAGFVRLDPQAHASSDTIEVRFGCGSTLHCSSSHLAELVHLLRAMPNEAEAC